MWIVVSYGTEFNMIWLYHRKYRNLQSDWPYENNLGNPLIHAVRTITRYVSSCGTTLIIIIMCCTESVPSRCQFNPVYFYNCIMWVSIVCLARSNGRSSCYCCSLSLLLTLGYNGNPD